MIEVNQYFLFFFFFILFYFCFIPERRATSTLNERESHYKQQIQDYENKLEQSIHDIQTIQSELTKLQEEKISNEKKSNDTINTLKQDYERQYEILKTELTELKDRGLLVLFSLFFSSIIIK